MQLLQFYLIFLSLSSDFFANLAPLSEASSLE